MAETKTEVKRFKKERIIKDGQFNDHKDILNVVLEDNKEYSLAEVKTEINKFLKRKVD